MCSICVHSFVCHSCPLSLHLFNKWKFAFDESQSVSERAKGRCREWNKWAKTNNIKETKNLYVVCISVQFNQPKATLISGEYHQRRSTSRKKFIKSNKINEIRSEIIIIDCSSASFPLFLSLSLSLTLSVHRFPCHSSQLPYVWPTSFLLTAHWIYFFGKHKCSVFR